MNQMQIAPQDDYKNKIHNFICDSPLYSPYNLNADPEIRDKECEYLAETTFKIDMNCSYCGKETTFLRHIGDNYSNAKFHSRRAGVILNNEIPMVFYCLRNNKHEYKFSLLQVDKYIVKIGQYPSMETISNGDIAKYRLILDNQNFSELHRAGGLASHGIGIASYVYLRRIFERLIFQHYDDHKKNRGEIDNFTNLRIDEKITALSAELPASLVQHKAVYKVLSKGIHELDEDSCKKYYPVVRAVIIAILEEDLQRREKQKAATELQSALSGILSELQTVESGG